LQIKQPIIKGSSSRHIRNNLVEFSPMAGSSAVCANPIGNKTFQMVSRHDLETGEKSFFVPETAGLQAC